MTRTPLSRSKVKGQGRQTALLTAALNVQRGAWERSERGNLLLRCGLQARSARRREAPTEGGERRGHIVAPMYLIQLAILSAKRVTPNSSINVIGFVF